MQSGACFFSTHCSSTVHHVEVAGARATATVQHARHHEQARELLRPGHRLLRFAPFFDRRHDALVIIDGVLRRDVRIVEAVVQDQAAAARAEARQVRIEGIHRLAELLHGVGGILLDVEAAQLPVLVLDDDVLHRVFRLVPVRARHRARARGVGCSSRPAPPRRRARCPDRSPRPLKYANRPDVVDRLHLLRRQAVRIVRPAGHCSAFAL